MQKCIATLLVCLAFTVADGLTACRAEGMDDDGNPLPELAFARLGTQRWKWDFRSGSGAAQLAFSADGKIVAAGSGRFIVWDVESGRPLSGEKAARIDEYFRPANVTRDGKTEAIAHQPNYLADTEVRLVDVQTGKLLRVIARNGYQLGGPTFSPDGSLLVTSATDSLCVWETATGKLHREIPGIRGIVAFAGDGQRMACAARKSIIVYALPDFAEVHRFKDDHDWVFALAFSDDGKRIARAGEQSVAVWEVATRKQISSMPGNEGPICSLAFSADGKALASGSSGDGSLCVWDLANRRQTHRFAGHTRAVASVAFSRDGKTLATGDGASVVGNLASGGGESHIRVWNLQDGKLLRKFPAHITSVAGLDFAPDGMTLASSGLDARVRLWDVANGTRLAQVRGNDGLHWAQFSPDGNTLLIGNDGGELSLWHADMKKKLHDLVSPAGPAALEFASFLSNGMQVFAQDTTDHRRGRWRVWDVATGKAVEDVEVNFKDFMAPRRCLLSPDGRTFATLARLPKPAIEIWDRGTRMQLARLPLKSPYEVALAFSRDSKTLASGSTDTTVLLWDVARARRLHLFEDLLRGTDTAEAQSRKFAAESGLAATYLKTRLMTFAGADKRVARLLVALDSEVFEEREQASRELAKIAADAESSLRTALGGKLSVEVRARLKQALDGIVKSDDGPPPFQAQHSHLSLTILEQLGTAEAHAAIAAVAEAAPDTEIGRDAKAALQRLQKVAKNKPK